MANGKMHPIPKQTRQTVDRCLVVAAERTIRKMMTARGPPNDRGKLVTMMKIGPRRFKVCSFAASDAEVEDAGYSPDRELGGCCEERVTHISQHTSCPKSNNPSRDLTRGQYYSDILYSSTVKC